MDMEPHEVDSTDSEKAAEPSIPSELEHQYHFTKGDQIADRYQVVDPLGFGGFSEVYHCQDLRLGREVAVKVLTEKGLALEEARAAARLKHPHIVQVYDVLTLEDGTPLIVFDYVEGETLEACLNRAQYRRLPVDSSSLRIISQISEALDYAHGQGVIHRDVKPSNIILDGQGNAYLTDFGLAEVKRPAEGTGKSMLSVEVQQRLSGTIPYMAPEQLKEGVPGNELSDIYSLGVAVYEMLTGQLPYRGRDASLIFQIATSDPLPPTLANAELPKGIEPVLLRTLEKNPENRYPSCGSFATELKEAARAYVEASTQYAQAQKFFETKQWRHALSAFKALQAKAPGFKDTPLYLEQTRHQVRLLELYEQAHQALKQGEYHDTLDTLNVLTQMDPDCDVKDLREQARAGLAQEERRSLDEQYQQAVQQFQQGEYQACLDALAVIRGRDPKYPDTEEIESPAREHVAQQQRLRALYNQGVEEMSREQWEEAIATLQELQEAAPEYEDVETRLAMAHHMARMSSFLREAKTFLEQEAFAACVDKLDELQRIDADYKQDEAARLRQEALNRLHEQADRLLQEERFEESLDRLAELRKRSPDHPDVEALETQAREGIRMRDLRAELDNLYQQAVAHLNRRDYASALELWQAIQQRGEDVGHPDPLDIQGRATEGRCMQLYNQAVGALAQKDPHQALELWHQVREVDFHYPDSQRVEERAQEMIAQRAKTKRRALRFGGGAVVLLLFVALAVAITRGCNNAAVSPIDTPTWTPSPTSTTPAPSDTPTRTPSPTSTTPAPPATSTTPAPSDTPTATPSPTLSSTSTLEDVATALQDSGIFAAPDANAQVLGGVKIGEQVLVWGRSAYGKWFYVRNAQGVEGFAYAPRFEWSGDYESLPVKRPTVEPPTNTLTPATSPGTPYPVLEIDLWDLPDGRCSGGIWYKDIYIRGQGGDGVYTYYWNDEKLAGPTRDGYTFEVYSVGGAVIGTGRVVSGDGQVAEKKLYISGLSCSP